MALDPKVKELQARLAETQNIQKLQKQFIALAITANKMQKTVEVLGEKSPISSEEMKALVTDINTLSDSVQNVQA